MPDLSALAAKYGGTPAMPPGTDLAALAAKYGGRSVSRPEEEAEIPSTTTGFEASGQMAPKSAVDAGLKAQALGTGAILGAGIGIPALGPEVGALASAAIRPVAQLAAKHPIISNAVASAAISQARQIPYVGKLIPPGAEFLPWLRRVGGAGEEPVPGEEPSTSPSGPSATPKPTAPSPRTIEIDPATGRPEFSDVIVAKPSAPMAKPAEVQQALETALGGKPLQPGVSLRNQPAAQAIAAGKLPEGFTPVQSSVIKGYKYDPAAQEFTAITNNGQTYTHGEVTPDQVAAFEGADSKGRAWTAAIRNSSPLVRKNGVPVKTATMQNAAGEVIPKSAAGMDDLTDILQQSLKNAQGK
jgi:hypothetical protein